MPNDSVASSDIINYSAEGITRLNFMVGIAYKESVARAREGILPVLLAHKEVLGGEALQPRVKLDSLTFLRGIPLPSGHCVALDVWGWMDSEPSARTALSDSGCTA